MDEISNKTLATLLVVAIVISLAGTFFAMRGVSQVTNYITGAAETDTGEALVNITSKTSILLTQPTVSFGGGYRNETCLGDASVEINLSTTSTTPPNCWVVDPTGTYNPADLVLENDGNVYVNLTINSTAYNQYFDSCGFTVITSGDANYSWQMEEGAGMGLNGDDTSGACLGTTFDTTLNSFEGTPEPVCSNYSYVDTEDELNFTIELAVPSGPTGECSASILFTAERSTN